MLRDFLEVFHIFSVIAWMSGLLYLPRLFAYHVEANMESATEAVRYFAVMERRLYRIIMTPAMVGVWVFGLSLLHLGDFYREAWLHGKLLLVLLMTGFHFYFGCCRCCLLSGKNRRSSKFYKRMNEVPAVILLLILFLVVLKPF